MPTIIYEERPPNWEGPPRRMSTEDYDIWRAFRRTDTNPWKTFYYDVGVGDGKPVPVDTTTPWRQHWLKETQRRIDVLGILPDKQVIIELRKRALSNALGRLWVYRTLYSREPLFQLPIETWLITDTTDPELEEIARAQQIRWITVP